MTRIIVRIIRDIVDRSLPLIKTTVGNIKPVVDSSASYTAQLPGA